MLLYSGNLLQKEITQFCSEKKYSQFLIIVSTIGDSYIEDTV